MNEVGDSHLFKTQALRIRQSYGGPMNACHTYSGISIYTLRGGEETRYIIAKFIHSMMRLIHSGCLIPGSRGQGRLLCSSCPSPYPGRSVAVDSRQLQTSIAPCAWGVCCQNPGVPPGMGLGCHAECWLSRLGTFSFGFGTISEYPLPSVILYHSSLYSKSKMV